MKNMTKMTKQEMLNLEFEPIDNQEYDTIQWTPEAGESLIGEYVEKREGCGIEKYTFYIIDDGENKYSLLANTVLNSLFEQVHFGEIIKITFEGFKKSISSQREYKDYNLHRAKPKTIFEQFTM